MNNVIDNFIETTTIKEVFYGFHQIVLPLLHFKTIEIFLRVKHDSKQLVCSKSHDG